jgi:hypothetical protein
MQNVPRVSPLFVSSHELANEASYWIGKNPTAGTGLATAATAIAVDHTKPFALIKGPTTAGKTFFLDYVRLVCTAAGTAGTSLRAFWHIDDTKADPTGGSALVLNNLRQDISNALVETKIWAGALAAAAASGNVRELVAPLLKSTIPAANDVYLMKFGGSDQGVSTAATIVYYGGPPLVVPANKIATLMLVLPSQSAASSYEIEIGGSER